MSPVHRIVFLLAAAAAVLFTLNLGGYDVWPPDEPRFADVAREMMVSGDYLVPRVNNETYLEKPPLLFWSMVVAAQPWGEMTEAAARIPSVVAGIVSLVLACLLAARIFGTQAALWTGLILLTSQRFWWQSRFGQIDMVLTGCMTITLYALWRWDESRKQRWLVLLWLGVAAGMLAKGPPALVFPLLTIFAFYRPEPYARRGTHWVLGVIAACALVALWYVPARLGGAETAQEAVQSGMAGNLFRNTIGRMFLGVSKAEMPWHYLQSIPEDLVPWTIFLPWTLLWTYRNRHDHRGMRFLLSWIIPALIFFSICIGKRSIYILPIFPTLGILMGASVDALLRAPQGRWLPRMAWVWAGICVLLAIAMPIGVYVVRAGEYAVLATPLIWLSVACAGFALSSLWVAWRTGGVRLPHVMAGQMYILFALVPLVLLPAVNTFKGAADFCAPVRRLSDAGEDFRLYSVGFSREEYIYYSRHPHTPMFTDIIPIPGLTDFDPYEMAMQQVKARKVIAGSVQDVPVADMAAVTEVERKNLRDAITSGIEATGKHASELHMFEGALTQALDAYVATFSGPEPAFMFVQDEDWRWMLPLLSTAPRFTILQHTPVGSRYVLLFANEAGAKLAAAHGS